MKLVLIFAVVAVTAATELVWLQDLNFDHDRRNLEEGLPSSLSFNLTRAVGGVSKVKLQLEENRRLNANAPVFVARVGKGRKQKLKKKKSKHMKGMKFYQDKKNGGTFKISCENTINGPCRRVMSGNFHMDGKAYDISPMPALFTARGLGNRGSVGTPHVLVERGDAPVMSEKLEAVDFIDDGPEYKRSKLDGLLSKIENLLSQKQLAMAAGRREKRSEGVYALELLIAIDPTMWNFFFDQTSGGTNRDEETEYKVRQHIAHIVNGISLRYEEIQDPDMDIYMTISGFLFYKAIDADNPLPLSATVENINGQGHTSAQDYLYSIRDWSTTLTDLPHNDHIMVFTGYELYSSGPSDTGVAGMAFVSGVCGNSRVSINEGFKDYFTTVSVAAHELGHNLGSSHDGSGTSGNCDPASKNIMSPSVARLENKDYSINPWRFSTCSVNAFKSYVDGLGSSNCLLDHGDFYNQAEYQSHISMLPGQLHDPDAQCKLVRGETSELCSSPTAEDICTDMLCTADDGYCWYYAAARGTSCGAIADDKWCIEGQCVSKSSSGGSTGTGGSTNTGGSTGTGGSSDTGSQTTPAPETTTPSQSSGCVDIGWNDWDCQKISNYFLDNYGAGPDDWCLDPNWNEKCCAFCEASESAPTTTTTTTPAPIADDAGCVDLGWTTWSCDEVSAYFLSTYGAGPQQWCLDPTWKGNCCALCASNGI